MLVPDAASQTLVVVVHFGDLDPSVRLAGSLVPFAPRVVVVANDGRPRPAELADAVTWLVPPANLGYAGAVVHALAESPPCRYVVALNNDIELPRETFQHCLTQLEEAPELGVLAPVLRYPDGTVQSGTGELAGLLRRERVGTDPGPRLVDCTWVTGAVMFLRADALRAVGWDRSYFLGSEDIDLCLNLADHGYRIACDGRVSAVHEQAREIGTMWLYYHFRNRLWLARKNYPGWQVALIVVAAWRDGGKVWLGDRLLRRGTAKSRLVLDGLRDGMRPDAASRTEPLPGEPIPLTRAASRGSVT